jgi:hypothetical protein
MCTFAEICMGSTRRLVTGDSKPGNWYSKMGSANPRHRIRFRQADRSPKSDALHATQRGIRHNH